MGTKKKSSPSSLAKGPAKTSSGRSGADSGMGPFLVSLSAILWATDALFRFPISGKMDATWIVTIEHLIGAFLLFPVIFIKYRKTLFPKTASQGFAVLLIGTGGSAFATVFFTASFRTINPSVAILIQKIQPVLVVLLAMLFLKERPRKSFWGWGALALGSVLVLNFPNLNFSFIYAWDPSSKGFVYSLLAAFLWACATVAGKALLNHTPTLVTTFWRYITALVSLLFLLLISNTPWPGSVVMEPSSLRALLYMSLGPGLLALLCYYSGLARTKASVATFAELIFPLGAIILNFIFLNASLNPIQILAGLILIYSVTQIHLSAK